jgi:hypothetical protein
MDRSTQGPAEAGEAPYPLLGSDCTAVHVGKYSLSCTPKMVFLVAIQVLESLSFSHLGRFSWMP